MSQVTLRLLFTYVIALTVLGCSFALIYQSRGDSAQAWLAIGTLLGYIFRDSGGEAAVRNSERLSVAAKTISDTAVANATTPPPTPPNG